MPEREAFPTIDILKQYPSLKEWLSRHRTAQLDGDKRLLSAEEKIEIFGGVHKLKTNVQLLRGKQQSRYLILLACHQEPMVGFEIGRFIKSVNGKDLAVGDLYENISKLMDEGLAIVKAPLTFIHLFPDGRSGSVRTNSKGYLTIENGTRQRVDMLRTTGRTDPTRKLAPEPL